ncbi:photosystem II S4 domain protein [bacterium]|nr:MAG: photosystem II S4 domain protein [bacterium]
MVASMFNREKVMTAVEKAADKNFLARILDRFEAVARHQGCEVTDFCDPSQQALAERVLGRYTDPVREWRGGCDEAERRRLLIYPAYLEPGVVEDGIVLLEVTGNFKFQRVTHRDFLGAFMSLGIKREKLGDIIVTDTGCQIFADNGVKDYITWNLQKIHRVTVRVREISRDELIIPAREVRNVSATVSSLRLDAVASAGFGASRTGMAREIAAEKVRLNWLVTTDSAASVKAGDVISIRGRGRLEVSEIRGTTKKGRISLVLKCYN